jgi:hypothetical protein
MMAVVGGHPACCLPTALNRVEFWRVGREATKLDFGFIFRKPPLARIVKPMTGTVVHYKEDLPARVVGDQALQKLVEGMPVEHGDGIPKEVSFDGYRPEDVGCLPFPPRRNSGLDTHR